MITIYGNKKNFYQWDLNQRLILTEVEVGTQINLDKYTVIAYEENGVVYANVPNILLQSGGTFNVYVWPEETVQAARFCVIPREKPSDYIYEETEIYGIKEVVEKALEEAKNSGEFDGKDGKTPERGVDYWTEADKAEIKSYVDEAILGGAW
jgi:hypothetical protein